MRLLAGICLTLALIAAERPSAKMRMGPKGGIKTPGILIPFENLKPELEFATNWNPQWIAMPDSLWLPGGASLERIDPKGKEAKFLPPVTGLKKACGGAITAFGSVWVPDCGSGAVARIDAKSGKTVVSLAFGAGDAAGSIAANADSIWLLTDNRTTLSRIDPVQNVVVDELRVPAGCQSLTFGENSLWLACPNDDKVLRINPATELQEKSIEGCAQPQALALGAGSVWAWCRKDGKVARIDPKTNKISATVDVGVPGASGSMAFGEGSLWLSLPAFPITRIDPDANRVAQQFWGEGGGAIAAGDGFVWLSNVHQGTLWKIDPRRIAATLAE